MALAINKLVLLPKTTNNVDKNTLITSLIEIKNQFLNNAEKNDIYNKMAIIVETLINKLALDEISIEEYRNLREELKKINDKRLIRIIDAYIYVLNSNSDSLIKRTNYFINKNNINILEERIVLIKYNSKRSTKYTSYNRNMTYNDVFNLIRYIDSSYLSLFKKIVTEIDIEKIEEIKENNNFYNNAFMKFEEEFAYIKENEIGKILYNKYKEDFFLTLQLMIDNEINIQKSKEDDEFRTYMRDSMAERKANKAKNKLKNPGFRKYSYVGDM